MDDFYRILVADSGATKTDWVCLTKDASGEHTAYLSGPGLSPIHHPENHIISELQKVKSSFGFQFDHIRFYGAGVGTPDMERQMTGYINSMLDCHDTKAYSDVLGAAKALYGDRSGVACIMGTGSSSCHYDGHKIDFRVPSLGYLLDDNGGGVAFGRRLLADIYKGLAPHDIVEAFRDRYRLTKEELIQHLYQEPAPNRWMASFFPFIADNHNKPYISELINTQIDIFLTREFSGYPEETLAREGISFVGSVADVLKQRLHSALSSRGWKMGDVIRKPIENLLNLQI